MEPPNVVYGHIIAENSDLQGEVPFFQIFYWIHVFIRTENSARLALARIS